MEPCIELSGFYGKDSIIQMQLDPSKGVIDLSKFFDSMFDMRDRVLGSPDFMRIEEKDGKSIFNFTRLEFVEAFFGKYAPNQLAEFLSKNMDTSGLMEESFISYIRKAEEELKLAFIVGIYTSRSDMFRLCPINFSLEELNSAIPHYFFKKGKYYRYLERGKRMDNKDTEFRTSRPLKKGCDFSELSDALLTPENPILITPNSEYGPETLHPIDIINRYNLPKEGLDVVRIK